MIRLLTALLLTTPVLYAVEESVTPPKKLSSVSMLPDGSQLHNVMFPRYDKSHRLVGVLKSSAMTLANSRTIAGDKVVIDFFNADQTPRGQVKLDKAVFDQTIGILKTVEPVSLRSDRLSAKGSGLYYSFEQGKGFLLGPVTTWIQNPTETTMNSNHSPFRTSAILGMSLLTLPLLAAPPPVVSPEEHAVIQQDIASKADVAKVAAGATHAELSQTVESSTAAAVEARKFLTAAAIDQPATADFKAADQPIEVKPSENDTTVESDGGMYFDADEGVFVFMKNVRVSDPRFSLSGVNELKIFVAKKPDAGPAKSDDKAKPVKPNTKENPGLGLGAKFGDVEKIVASGAVRIIQKSTEAGKEPVEASGAIFSYQPKVGEIIISGGYPWVKQGTNVMRAKEPNLTLRIQKNGSFITQGNWQINGNLDQKR